MSSGGWDVEHLGIILESLKWDELQWMRCRASQESLNQDELQWMGCRASRYYIGVSEMG